MLYATEAASSWRREPAGLQAGLCWRNPTLNADKADLQEEEPYRHGRFPGPPPAWTGCMRPPPYQAEPYLGLGNGSASAGGHSIRGADQAGERPLDASVNYWKRARSAPRRKLTSGWRRCRYNAVGVDSELALRESQSTVPDARGLQRWQRTLARRTVGSRGWQWRKGASMRHRLKGTGQRAPPGQPPTGQEVGAGHREPERGGHGQTAPSGKGHRVSRQRRGRRSVTRRRTELSSWKHRFYPSSKLSSDCGAHNARLGRELHWTASAAGADRNEKPARSANTGNQRTLASWVNSRWPLGPM